MIKMTLNVIFNILGSDWEEYNTNFQEIVFKIFLHDSLFDSICRLASVPELIRRAKRNEEILPPARRDRVWRFSLVSQVVTRLKKTVSLDRFYKI